ncbi:MAG: hypothetical protein DRJ37_00830 [Thermoprotei archaeon]|nr:MAG: hypothetical protein DRJ37_00830 [Thermoprotei archaeon]
MHRLSHLARYEEEETTLPLKEIVKRLMPLVKPHAKYFSAAIAGTMGRMALNLAFPMLMGYLVDSALGGDFDELLWFSVIFFGCAVAYWFINYTRIYLTSLAGQRFIRDLRDKLFRKLLKVKIAFLRRGEVGRLVSKVMNDVDVIGDTFTSGLIDMFADIAAMSGAFVIMVFISPQLTLAILPLIPAIFLINYYLAVRARETFRKARKAIAKVTAKVEQEISGAAVVKTYVQRRKIEEREFEKVSREYVSTNVEATKVVSSVNPSMSVIRAIGVAIILHIGGNLIQVGEITVGTMVTFYGYLDLFFRPLQTLAIFFNSIQSALAAAERVTELLKVDEEESGVLRKPINGLVEFKEVYFGYEEELPVIKGVSLKVKPGEMVAIVGPTGGGKSTLAKLLLRFYDPWSGRILLDGIDVDRYDLSFLRKVIAYVPQDPAVISGRVYDNLVAGRPDMGKEEVDRLLKELSVDGLFDALPGGLEAEIVEEGRNLSKGQRQVISLVRALISNPRVLVLDEATSNVDVVTELKIYKGLKKLIKKRNISTIVIAHRLIAITDANRIYVIDDGKVVEEGTHEELLAKGGLYAKLWRAQSPEVILSLSESN